tara:strand:- start:35494 stop:35679 length:186 start_codon:yes stop_codon:yes gene_type:complete
VADHSRIQRHFPGNAPQGQVASNVGVTFTINHHPPAPECGQPELINVKEVFAAQVPLCSSA